MASQRQQNSGEPETVSPHAEGAAQTPGISTMAEMFGQPQIVDEVQEVAWVNPLGDSLWVIRPNTNVEDMTVGLPENHFSMKAGTRYRVPERVAEILYN